MALIDVIMNEINDQEFVYKFPSDDLRIGSQLVVHPGQTAFFVKGGQICDEFTSGTYTIKTSNIPLLNKLINLPFGKETPFVAEVWYINQITKLGMPWGTTAPLQVEDPKYGIIVPLRSYGQYGFSISQPRLFLETLVGNMSSFTADKIESYFKAKIVSLLNNLIAQKIVQDKISILDISTKLTEMSDFCDTELKKSFAKYGILLQDFTIMSINFPQDDPSIIKLKEAKDFAARLNITGRDAYQMQRSYDVLEKAAGNTGAGGQFAAMGAGMGMGVNLGATFGSMAQQYVNTQPTPPPPPVPTEPTYYIYINGRQYPDQTSSAIATLISQGQVNAGTLVWKPGMSAWMQLSMVPELASLLQSQTPPPVPPQNN